MRPTSKNQGPEALSNIQTPEFCLRDENGGSTALHLTHIVQSCERSLRLLTETGMKFL
jgi:hypothetical protein